jgi:hypothetical protein
MEISMGLAEALARFAYVQSHQAKTSDADRQKEPESWRRGYARKAC